MRVKCIAEIDKFEKVRWAAVENPNFTDQAMLAEIAKKDEGSSPAMTKLTNKTYLREVAQYATNSGMRYQAVDKIWDQAVLAKIAKNDKDLKVRQAAAKKVTDKNIIAEFERDNNAIGIANDLIEQCIDPNNIHAVRLDPAIEPLKRAGITAFNWLASLLHEFLKSRSEGIVYPLNLACHLQLTDTLKRILMEIAGSRPVTYGARGRFVPEIFGEGKIGWTDSTHSKVIDLAEKALNQPRG